MQEGLGTTRVGGGRSAGLIAVVVAGILATVVWIGISGRPPAPAPTAAAIAVASSLPGSKPLTRRPSPTSPASPAATPRQRGRPAEPPPTPAAGNAGDAARSRNFFNVSATIGGRQYMAELEQVSSNVLRGGFEMPIPPPATRGKLELTQVWLTGSHDSRSTLGMWDLRLEALSGASGRAYTVLDQTQRALPWPARENAPRLVRRGYRIEVRAQSGVPLSTVVVEIRIASQQLAGDDGLVGGLVTRPATTTR